MTSGWHPATWRSAPAAQQPVYADAALLERVEADLAGAAPLVTLAQVDALRARLAEAAAGRALLLQGGDCAETFAEPDVAGLGALFEGLASLLPLPVVSVARIAGQFAKPRTIEGKVWRGEIVNGRDALEPDPKRMLRAYGHAAATMQRLPAGLHASHEALLLPYEQALVRRADDGRWWSGSGHMLWIGDRTRQLGGAHVAFAAGLANPVGVKLGEIGADELRRLADAIDPAREPGRLTLIVRMGAAIDARLPVLMRALRQEGRQPLWVSDPLHGNTQRGGARKVRLLSAVAREAEAFVAIARSEGVHAGGLHLELTPEDVAEVTGGLEGEGWTSACDPRLNPRQAEAVVRAFAAAAQERDAA
ncbi:3-deoxy-7-phosphoheptulonate synthase [Sphingomonas sp. LHG3406-1]|uniref:3-deoxy-7-phosphoheptulonate synthase n=1 Tax=Sphingomonas sp. LHG3406-1 TaxID=2804617 RepID=UPI0026186437|nr:3-deoxy-7-phosphoheptulonate synthase [Sphingomonas sp. LHG3406-1]